jgi:2-dehydro-3-deoxygalactonokinase
MSSDYHWITLDGGTTNTRACLMANGRMIDSATAAVGVRNSDDTANSPVKRAVADVLGTLCTRHRLDPAGTRVIASGMIGSDAGLVNVPHIPAPATIQMAQNAMKTWHEPQFWPGPVAICPGVKSQPLLNENPTTPIDLSPFFSTADIMRGEEVQAWGLRKLLKISHPEIINQPWLLLWPGSHTKLIRIQPDGSISGSFTTLAGELFAALKSATLLKRSLGEAAPEAFTDDLTNHAAQCVRQFGLLRAAFWTRVADLNNTLDADHRTAWLSAAVIAEDCQGLCRHEWLANPAEKPLLFVGGDSLRQSLYCRMIRHELDLSPVAIAPEICDMAAAIGVSCVAGLVDAD